MNPVRLLKNLFADFMIWSSGTWVGAPDDSPAKHQKTGDEQTTMSAATTVPPMESETAAEPPSESEATDAPASQN